MQSWEAKQKLSAEVQELVTILPFLGMIHSNNTQKISALMPESYALPAMSGSHAKCIQCTATSTWVVGAQGQMGNKHLNIYAYHPLSPGGAYGSP